MSSSIAEKARLRAEWEASLTPQDRVEIKNYMSNLGKIGGLRKGRKKVRGDSDYYRNLGKNNCSMQLARAGRARKKAERDKAKQEENACE